MEPNESSIKDNEEKASVARGENRDSGPQQLRDNRDPRQPAFRERCPK